jgi:hypothetical protein
MILMTPALASVMKRTEGVMRLVHHAAEHGEHNFLLGEYYAMIGKATLARRRYRKARTLFESVMRVDDAVRAAIGECRVAIEEGDRAEAARLGRYIERFSVRIEHVDIRAQLRALRLADAYLSRKSGQVLVRHVRECEASESGAQFLTLLRNRRVRLAVCARAGRVEEAVQTAVEYHGLVRRAMANLPREVAADGLLRRVGFEEASMVVSRLHKAGDHATTA